ncbi:hypothetical protein [Levilactobacillus brevis]|jgi:hypothetical protein|uniref:hypothetical protein n=1 Tax=Levilactobacillus brevis TaxID=1580 RepID=UPI001CDAB0BD|nr:hypothetical protein [Levilactobacillus brevis]MDV2566771.1 hypothetical protein [Levilactobacillus brevis]UVW17453.1 hypothetical protein NX820_05655 [Levilactobacillus brevis]
MDIALKDFAGNLYLTVMRCTGGSANDPGTALFLYRLRRDSSAESLTFRKQMRRIIYFSA